MRLNYSSLGWTDIEACSLGKALPWCMCATDLSLFDNEISDDGACAIGEGLRTNRVLENIRIDRNEISEIEDAPNEMRKNKGVRHAGRSHKW